MRNTSNFTIFKIFLSIFLQFFFYYQEVQVDFLAAVKAWQVLTRRGAWLKRISSCVGGNRFALSHPFDSSRSLSSCSGFVSISYSSLLIFAITLFMLD